ncbi:hypothetical protein SAMN05444157_3620 [Frankineae bacterium MT45]|nr:hypothetical protein SAMN05444157_3620 [Frankineae bacterium MT45]
MQFSLFGAATAAPTLADFDGVLIGGGHWVRHGDAARLSVVVADRWRADELHQAFHERGVGESSDPIVRAEEGFAVRSAFSGDLRAEADRWTVGANEAPPPGFRLEVGGLRLWAVTAGRADDVGYLLGTDQPDDVIHTVSGAQLSRLGLAAVSLTARSGGPAWRVTSTKRLRRLAELLGEAPIGSGRDWPTF